MNAERFNRLSYTLRRGACIRCRECGRSEFFEGGMLHAVLASINSPNWYLDENDMATCKECVEKRKAGEVS